MNIYSSQSYSIAKNVTWFKNSLIYFSEPSKHQVLHTGNMHVIHHENKMKTQMCECNMVEIGDKIVSL